MKALFLKRRQLFHKQCARYLKYVLNDHFILFMLLGMGFVMVQYSQLIKHPPQDTFVLRMVVIVLLLGASFMGDFTAYLERPDQQFLLGKEAHVAREIERAHRKGFLIWTIIQLVTAVFLYPLALAAQLSLVSYVILVLLSIVINVAYFRRKLVALTSQQRVSWDAAINHDRHQKQAVLKFFSLFTQVKGISQSVRRRAFLDPVLTLFQQGTWLYLFARAFLRSGDYLRLSLRLALLSFFSLSLIGQDLVATVLAILFNYLLLFQLMALYNHYDYQYMTSLFPVTRGEKKRSLRLFLNGFFFFLLTIQVALAAVFFQDRVYLLVLIGVQIVLNVCYLPYKIEKLID
ncbi:ABC transporter permease [Streptococcus ovuberis]|uniref:Multidrug ABC transporter permease n=1 Tax=Streptococcus ovuberis TaxID=1936207 RepID=A0A7X6S013_9STRE|nr:ABC transporter permease [Streptococcus ovuberis]NKZ19624.1 multidrug ABC transporter permease [Streptococcus ovuberis]